jgi:hypothetical protein
MISIRTYLEKYQSHYKVELVEYGQVPTALVCLNTWPITRIIHQILFLPVALSNYRDLEFTSRREPDPDALIRMIL